VQLALQASATVIAVAHRRDHARLSALGDVTLVDYNDLDAFSAIESVELWFDLIGGKNAIMQLGRVAKIKRLVTVPTITAAAICDNVTTKGTVAQGMLISPDADLLRKLTKMVENAQLKLNIAKYMNFTQAALAHQQLESGEIKGKIVLEFN